MFPKFKYFLICAAMGGCIKYNARETVILDVDPCLSSLWGGFGETVVRQGAHAWDGFGGKFRLPDEVSIQDFNNAPRLPIHCADDLGPITVYDGGAESFEAGYYDATNGTITVSLQEFKVWEPVNSDWLTQPWFIHHFSELISHEIGHASGLVHTDVNDGKAIMFYQVNGSPEPDELDWIDWCNAQGGC
jgi:hypothetical protein